VKKSLGGGNLKIIAESFRQTFKVEEKNTRNGHTWFNDGGKNYRIG